MNARPLSIGPGNCVVMTGHSWRWVRDHHEELGVEIIHVDGKSFILADALLAALEKRAPKPETTTELDELAEFREQIRRAG